MDSNAQRTGRPRKSLNAHQAALLREHGFNWSQVAQSLGVNRNTIVRRRSEDAVFRYLTDAHKGSPSPEDEAEIVLLSLEDSPERFLVCEICGNPRSAGSAKKCRRCYQIQAAIKASENECSMLFARLISQGRKERKQQIALLPAETRKIIRKLEQVYRRSSITEMAFDLRRAADALESVFSERWNKRNEGESNEENNGQEASP